MEVSSTTDSPSRHCRKSIWAPHLGKYKELCGEAAASPSRIITIPAADHTARLSPRASTWPRRTFSSVRTRSPPRGSSERRPAQLARLDAQRPCWPRRAREEETEGKPREGKGRVNR